MLRKLLYILTVQLSLAIAFGVNAQGVGVELDTSNSVKAVISDQLIAFQSKDHSRAYSHAAPNIKGFFTTVDQFIGMVKGGYGAIYNSDSFAYGRNRAFNGEVYQEVLITDQMGKQWQAVYSLKQQADGSWKITGVKINPHKGAAT